MYLLDTNVISEIRKPKPHGAVIAWLSVHSKADMLISAITLLELQQGAERTRRQDRAMAARLDEWIEDVSQAFSILPLDGEICREGARLLVGRSDDVFEDAMIAATARVHRLTVATRNVRDFKPFGVPVLNPFTSIH